MKIIIILVASLLILGCETTDDMPTFPEDLRNYYVIDISSAPVAEIPQFTELVVNPESLPSFDTYGVDVTVNCLHFDIISKHPFKIKYLGVVNYKACIGVGGLRPDDSVKFFNYVDDLVTWGKGKVQRCSQ